MYYERMKLKPVAIIAAALLFSTLTGCSVAYDNSPATPVVSADTQDSDAVLKKLRWGHEIELKKAVFSVNKSYTVSVDGEEVGELKGQYFPVFGDTFALYSTAGNLVASEGEKLKLPFHGAAFYDYNNVKTGEVHEDLSLIMAHWTVVDAAGKTVGEAKQNFSITMKFTVNDPAGKLQYTVKKDYVSLTGSKLHVIRETNEPTVAATDALFLAAIGNELDEAQDDEK